MPSTSPGFGKSGKSRGRVFTEFVDALPMGVVPLALGVDQRSCCAVLFQTTGVVLLLGMMSLPCF